MVWIIHLLEHAKQKGILVAIDLDKAFDTFNFNFPIRT